MKVMYLEININKVERIFLFFLFQKRNELFCCNWRQYYSLFSVCGLYVEIYVYGIVLIYEYNVCVSFEYVCFYVDIMIMGWSCCGIWEKLIKIF